MKMQLKQLHPKSRAEDEMPVGDLLKNVGTEPFSEFHHPLLMAGGTEMTGLAGEGQNIFMAAIPALHQGKALVQVSAFQAAVNDFLNVGLRQNTYGLSNRSSSKSLKMVFHAP
jgi:hypothetical protein